MVRLFKRNVVRSIDVNTLDLLGKLNLIDIREIDEYRSGHLQNAINIPMDLLITLTNKYLDKSKEYHLICQSGIRSMHTCKILNKIGYNTINVASGTRSYRGALVR